MAAWTLDDAERHLLGLELFGMRFGLDRMRRLTTALGAPQERFGSIHVVGTNGKSSTVRFAAAILARHGLRTGAYLSPHLVSFAERVLVDGQDIDGASFAAAVERAARAAALVNRRSEPGDEVTQFELLTAAAFSELARREVGVAVIEAGLGGRYDGTNVIPSRVQVLTGVGLEHTRWLGPTIADIAREKLAVVRDGSTVVVPADLHPDAEPELEAAAARHGARVLRAESSADVPLAARGRFQHANFALARAAAEAYLGRLDPEAVTAAARTTLVPGRLQEIDADPLTLLDGAHNPAGAAAVAASLRDVFGTRPLWLVLSILDDKDAAGMLRALMPHSAGAVLTANRNPRALPPATLESLARQVGAPGALLVERDPRAAVALARERAGRDGGVLATGSIYLVADLLRPAGQARASML